MYLFFTAVAVACFCIVLATSARATAVTITVADAVVTRSVSLYHIHFPKWRYIYTSSEWRTFYCLFYFKAYTLFHFNRIEIVAKNCNVAKINW